MGDNTSIVGIGVRNIKRAGEISWVIEAHAILEALRYIQEKKYQSAVIYIDKRDNKHQDHQKARMVQETELTNDHKQIIITWIPSHQGKEGNEKAEEATIDRTNIPIPHQNLLASTTKAEREE